MSDRQYEIIKFIKKFEGSEDTFLYGCCYWFAFILNARFGGETVYSDILGHFLQKIDGRLYDITGDVTDDWNECHLISWAELPKQDELLYKTIVRDCVNFTSSEENT